MAIPKNTKAKTEEVVEEVVEKKATPKKAPAKPKRQAKKEVDLKQQVLVINMSQGSLHYSTNRGNGYLDLGQYLNSDFMSVEDLQVMRNTASGMFTKGWLYIDDEEVVEYLGLQKEMENILTEDKMEEFFELDATAIERELPKYSSGVQESLYQLLKVKFEEGLVTDIFKIRAIEKVLGIDSNLSITNI